MYQMKDYLQSKIQVFWEKKHAWHFLEFLDSRLLQLFDLLLDYGLKSTVAHKQWQFSSTVRALKLRLFSQNVLFDCSAMKVKWRFKICFFNDSNFFTLNVRVTLCSSL